MSGNVLSLAACTTWLALVCSTPGAEPPSGRRGGPAASDPTSEFVIGKPVVHANLTIFPVSAKTPRNDDRFVTLDEAIRAGTVEILEKSAVQRPARRGTPRQATDVADPLQSDGDDGVDPFGGPIDENRASDAVNGLMVVNRSEKPLYLMPGEIIVGGRQDRTIARELIVPPGGRPVAIDVYCVEHGRWGKRSAGEYAGYLSAATANSAIADSVSIAGGNETAAEQAAAAANAGKFIGSVGSLGKSGRIAVQKGDGQGAVWDEVRKENTKASVKSRSGAFTGNYAEKRAVARLEPYIKKLSAPIAQTNNVVGVLVAVNGNVESMDVFEATPLFKKLWPKLLKSYALDGANATKSKDATKTCSREDAVAFLRTAANAEAKKSSSDGDVEMTHRENDRVLLFSVHERRHRQGAASGGAMGGFGGVHSSAFAK